MSEQDLRDRVEDLERELRDAREALDGTMPAPTSKMILTIARAVDYIFLHTDLETWGTPHDDLRELLKELEPDPDDEYLLGVDLAEPGGDRTVDIEYRQPYPRQSAVIVGKSNRRGTVLDDEGDRIQVQVGDDQLFFKPDEVRLAPQSNRYMEVWSEGYQATGEQADATRLITGEFDSFDDAVEAWLLASPNNRKFVRKGETGLWAYWGCRLFDNEADARKSFG